MMDESQLLSRLRAICLSLPEVRETIKWGHPTFEAGKKMFAVLDRYNGRACIAFKASREQLPELLDSDLFFEAPYAARFGWVCMFADGSLNWREVDGLLRDSYRQVALKRMLAALDEQEGAQRKSGRRKASGR
jgi:predicted DNA-binding protein (MmcQ/YjbR family)